MFFLSPVMSITHCQLTLSVEKCSHGYVVFFDAFSSNPLWPLPNFLWKDLLASNSKLLFFSSFLRIVLSPPHFQCCTCSSIIDLQDLQCFCKFCFDWHLTQDHNISRTGDVKAVIADGVQLGHPKQTAILHKTSAETISHSTAHKPEELV